MLVCGLRKKLQFVYELRNGKMSLTDHKTRTPYSFKVIKSCLLKGVKLFVAVGFDESKLLEDISS